MTLVLFEDELTTQLYPITIGRSAAMITCGGYTLVELLAVLGERPALLPRAHLREVLRADGFAVAPPAGETAWHGGAKNPLALVNARLVPSASVVERALRLVRDGRPGVVKTDGVTALAVLPADAPPLPVEATPSATTAYLQNSALPPLASELPLLQFPHDVLRHHPAALAENLAVRLRGGGYRETADGVFVAEGAKLGEYVVCDAASGPIVLDAEASIGPHCYLRGPVYVGRGARVIEHAALKDGVCLGHTTKTGGEVEGSIIEPYTNKQHHGFLGHSYLGSWINLGAGTCNSDLKNTYGTVNMEYQGRKVPTGMQFFGVAVGDYAKTAINTGIFTGKTIGAGSMVYGFVTTNVPSFVNYARTFGQVTEAPVDVLAATQARMFVRRRVEQRPCDVRLLHAMYELTQHERQLAGEPLSL